VAQTTLIKALAKIATYRGEAALFGKESTEADGIASGGDQFCARPASR